MASLLNKDDEDITGTTPQSQTVSTTTAGGSGGPSTGGGSGDGGGTTSTSAGTGNASQPITASPQEDTQKAVSLNQNVDFSPLLNFVQGQGVNARNAVNFENNQFQGRLNGGVGAGQPIQFGDYQQDTLSSVLRGEQPISVGQDVLNYKNSPEGIASTNYDPLVAQYSTTAGQTGNATGINSLLNTLAPQLTPGERAYDAMIYGQNPLFQEQSHNLISDAADVTGAAANATSGSSDALKKRAGDVSAFNTAGTNFVTGQRDSINTAINNQMAQAQKNEINLQNALAQLRTGTANISDIQRDQLTFDPAAYAAQDVKGVYDTTFDRIVDPREYLSYQSGELPTRNNMATADDITRYNNAEALLNQTDRLVGGPYKGGVLNINQAALYQALAQAQAARDAADAAWLAAHTPKPAEEKKEGGVYEYNDPGGHEGEGGGGGDAGSGGMGGTDGSGAGGSSGGASGGSDMGGESDGSAGEAGGGNSGESGGAEGAEGAATGGLIKHGRVFRQNSKPEGLVKGGYIPKNAGPPGRDTLRNIALNNGEFVVQAPSVVAVGPSNLAQLNKVASLPAAKEQVVRRALHQALTRAALGAK